MSLSKSKCWYSNSCLHFLKRAYKRKDFIGLASSCESFFVWKNLHTHKQTHTHTHTSVLSAMLYKQIGGILLMTGKAISGIKKIDVNPEICNQF
jgi:hypothetical protein